jgi:hypothetical protein
VHRLQQVLVDPVQPCLAFPAEVEVARPDLVAQRQDPVAFVCEEGVAEDHERPDVAIAEMLELVGDVRDGARAVRGQEPMRTIGAELRASAAGQQGERSERPG